MIQWSSMLRDAHESRFFRVCTLMRVRRTFSRKTPRGLQNNMLEENSACWNSHSFPRYKGETRPRFLKDDLPHRVHTQSKYRYFFSFCVPSNKFPLYARYIFCRQKQNLPQTNTAYSSILQFPLDYRREDEKELEI